MKKIAIIFIMVFSPYVSAVTFDDIMKEKKAIDKQSEINVQKIAELQKSRKKYSDYGLVFFFSESCGYCHRFAPILKRFAKDHSIEVKPITVTGGGLPQYPNPEKINQRLLLHYYGATDQVRYPTVFMYKRGDLYGANIRLTNGETSYAGFSNLWKMAHQEQYMRVFKQ